MDGILPFPHMPLKGSHDQSGVTSAVKTAGLTQTVEFIVNIHAHAIFFLCGGSEMSRADLQANTDVLYLSHIEL